MSRNNFWKLVFVILVLVWSFYEIYPPTGSDLTNVFLGRAVMKDAVFTNIVERLNELQKQNPERKFANLIEAVGTNNVAKYFPFFPEAKGELNPNRYVLDRLQRE